LPNGYDTKIGEAGNRLSGGQRQRIALAQTVARNPSVIVFDEPTSALDAASERSILETIKTLAADRAVLLVTHSPAACRIADRIFVLNGGAVVQSGTFDELLSVEGEFRRILKRHEHERESESAAPKAVSEITVREVSR
jgi:ABC-type multidrug transport system fused ATPase/permease subunit